MCWPFYGSVVADFWFEFSLVACIAFLLKNAVMSPVSVRVVWGGGVGVGGVVVFCGVGWGGVGEGGGGGGGGWWGWGGGGSIPHSLSFSTVPSADWL